MSWRPGVAPLLLVALLGASVLLPLAGADHVYSHRYVVYGRVVDANDNPVPGLTVDIGWKDFQPDGACVDQPNINTEAYGPTRTTPVTNQFGEFIFCFHVHTMNRIEPGTGYVRFVDGPEHTQDIQFDGYFRGQHVLVKLPEAHPSANEEILDSTYTVSGRLWRPAGDNIRLESVPVFGWTVDDVPVNVTITKDDGSTLTAQTVSNGYGDFSVRVPVTERLTSGTVRIEAAGETFEAPVQAAGVTHFRAEYGREKTDIMPVLTVVGAIGGVALVGGAGWYGIRRMSAAREEAVVRANASRKRANR